MLSCRDDKDVEAARTRPIMLRDQIPSGERHLQLAKGFEYPRSINTGLNQDQDSSF